MGECQYNVQAAPYSLYHIYSLLFVSAMAGKTVNNVVLDRK